MICSSTISSIFFSLIHYGLLETSEIYSGFRALNVTKTFWIYFLADDDVSSGGSFDIFHIVMFYMHLIENVSTDSSPYSCSFAGCGGAPVFGSRNLQ